MNAIFLRMPTGDLVLIFSDGRVLVIEPDGDCYVPGDRQGQSTGGGLD